MKTMMSAVLMSTIIAAPVFATGSQNLSQLEILAQGALDKAGIVYPVESLTPAQLAEIKSLVERDENDIDTELRTILEIKNPDANTVNVTEALPSAASLRSSHSKNSIKLGSISTPPR